MKKIIKILKINILSILALPLLLVSTVSKLIARAFDKAFIIVKMLLVMFVIVIAFEVMKTPESILEAIACLIMAILIGGIFLAILFWVIGLISAFLAVVLESIITCFECIHNLSFSGYLKLSEICGADYQIISMKEHTAANAIFCLFYTLLQIFSKLIAGIVSLSFALSIGLSAFLVIGSLLYGNHLVKDAFDLNLFQYLGKFDAFSVIYGGLLYVVFLAAAITILVSLGLEWYKWSRELHMTSEEYRQYIHQLQANRICMEETEAGETAAVNDANLSYMKNLEDQISAIEDLGSSINNIQDQKENSLLRISWNEYLRDLKELVDTCNSYKKGIPGNEFQKMIPKIQALEKQKKEIEQMVAKLKDEYSNPAGSAVFFAGCDTPEKIEQRYKSLCKTYHPDTGNGDEDTFKRMVEEYNQLKQVINT